MVKLLMSRMSPLEWVPLKVPLAFSLIGLTKNQKPAVESPLLSKRSSPAYRTWSPVLGSLYRAAKAFSPVHRVANGMSYSQNKRCRFAHRTVPPTFSVACSMW